MTEPRRALEVTLQIPIRTYDIDFAGVVSNIVYIRWLEDLRIEIMNRHYPIAEQIQDGFAPVVLQTNIDYKQSLKMGDRPTSSMWVASLETLRWTVNAEISNDGKVSEIAQQMGIFVNLQTNKPICVPTRLQQQYKDSLSQSLL